MKYALFIVLSTFVMTAQAQPKRPVTPTAKHFWHRVETTASPQTIWSIWTDVPNWHTWDTGLKKAELNESFTLNAKGKLISLEDRTSKFKIVNFQEGQTYTFKTQLPLGGLYVKRYLTIKNGKTYFTHEVWFKGFTAGIFSKMLGGDFKDMLPKVMENIKRIAETN